MKRKHPLVIEGEKTARSLLKEFPTSVTIDLTDIGREFILIQLSRAFIAGFTFALRRQEQFAKEQLAKESKCQNSTPKRKSKRSSSGTGTVPITSTPTS